MKEIWSLRFFLGHCLVTEKTIKSKEKKKEKIKSTCPPFWFPQTHNLTAQSIVNNFLQNIKISLEVRIRGSKKKNAISFLIYLVLSAIKSKL